MTAATGSTLSTGLGVHKYLFKQCRIAIDDYFVTTLTGSWRALADKVGGVASYGMRAPNLIIAP